jgi:hypothetical protein
VEVPQPRNPLAIIALFVTAVEGVFGWVARSHLPDHLLTCLVYSMVLLIFVVAIGFFVILWFRPAHWYSPEQFSSSKLESEIFSPKERDFPKVDTRVATNR